MKRLLALAVALMVISAPAFASFIINGDFSDGETGWTRWQSGWGGGFQWDATQGFGQLSCSGGSFGWYQAVTVTPGKQYTIVANWMGNGSSNWCELLFFNDDGRAIYDQCDDPHDASIITKVDGWGMNGGMPFKNVEGNVDFAPITEFYYPSGLKTNTITATGTTMYVVLKTGANGGSTICAFDDVALVIPEPGSVVALVSGLLGLGGVAIRRKR